MNLVYGRRKWWNGYSKLSRKIAIEQLIHESTHLVADSPSCIDLISTSLSNLVLESGLPSSLHPSKLSSSNNLCEIQTKTHYPPPNEWEIWHYEKANVDHIAIAINEFSWERIFKNKNMNGNVKIFHTTIKNILSNYTPHETITSGDRDPPWINKNMKQLILEKYQAYKSWSN